jgi:steroid delta-isomerase-like uncharacterized protein
MRAKRAGEDSNLWSASSSRWPWRSTLSRHQPISEPLHLEDVLVAEFGSPSPYVGCPSPGVLSVVCGGGTTAPRPAAAEQRQGWGAEYGPRRDDMGVRMKKANRELIQARYEAVNAHDFERFQSFYADSVVWRDPGLARPVRGPRAVRRRLETWAAVVPNLKWRLDDLFGEGDRVCAQFTFTGSHEGALTDGRGNELAPTNRTIRLQGVGVYSIDEGKIVDSRIYFDLGQFGASRS